MFQETAGQDREASFGHGCVTAGIRGASLSGYAGRPGGVDFGDDGVEVIGTADVIDHTGPEGAGANFAGHEVGGVEAEAGGVGDQFSQAAFEFLSVHVWGSGLMDGESAAVRHPATGRFWGGEVFHEGVDFWPFVELSHDVTGDEEGAAVSCVDAGQVEDPIISAELDAFGEEGGDEVALFVEPAAWRVFKHGQGGIAEVGGDDGGTAA